MILPERKVSVGIVVLNFYNSSLTSKLCSTLLMYFERASSAGLFCQLLVVDNSMTEDDFETQAAEISEVIGGESRQPILLWSGGNVGFAGGMNYGLQHYRSTSDHYGFYLLLNNDISVTLEQFLLSLNFYRDLLFREQEGFYGVQLVRGETVQFEPNVVESYWGEFDPHTGNVEMLGDGVVLEESSLQEGGVIKTFRPFGNGKISYPNGAVLFVSEKVLNLVGLLNERYFLYMEEVEFTTRCFEAGVPVGVLPCYYAHRRGTTISQMSSIFRIKLCFLEIRNKYWFAKSYFPNKKYKVILFQIFRLMKLVLLRSIRSSA